MDDVEWRSCGPARGVAMKGEGAERRRLTKGPLLVVDCGKEKAPDCAQARWDATRQKSATGISLAFLFLVRHLSTPGMLWEPRPIRLDAGARPGVTLARPATGWGSGPVCNKNPGAAAKSMTDTCRGPRPHRNLIGCPRNQGPRTRTSLLRHQLSRRNPSPVHKAYEAWAAWKMPHRHRSDVPRTSPDILEPSGDSASGCIAPKPSPDPVLTPSHENPVNPQERAASRIRIRGIGTPRPRAFVRGSGGRHTCGNPRIEMHTGDKRLQRRDMELTRYLHADIHHASAPAASAHWADVPQGVYSAVAMKLSA